MASPSIRPTPKWCRESAAAAFTMPNPFYFSSHRRRSIYFSSFSSSTSPLPSSPYPTRSPNASPHKKDPRTSSSSGSIPAAGDQPIPEISGAMKRSNLPKSFRRRPLWRRIFFASKKVRSVILLNVLSLIYASNFPVLKEVEVIVDPALFTMVRFAVSALPFLPFIIRERGDAEIRSGGIELGCWISLGYLAEALGMLTSDAGRASFISAFTVVTVPLVDALLGASVPALTWSGALVSLVGIVMLESSGSPPCVGDILNILGAIFFGIHLLRTEHISRAANKEKFLALLGYEMCVAALLSALWYFCRATFGDVQEFSLVSWEWTTVWDWVISFPWIPALYTGAFSTGLCSWAEISAMCDVSATETAIIFGLEPLWGAAFAWFLLGERWDATGWVGAALILGGSLTVQIFGLPPEKSKKNSSRSQQLDHLNVSDKPNDYSLSPVVVNSRKDVMNLLKQDKL